jgi:hypothetical protein
MLSSLKKAVAINLLLVAIGTVASATSSQVEPTRTSADEGPCYFINGQWICPDN